MKKIVVVFVSIFTFLWSLSAQTAVDLGLSVKWASCNIGASNPGQYGNYYAWGETEPKDEYSWTNYRFRISGSSDYCITFSKYKKSKMQLELIDDVANIKLGDNWHIPTKEEWKELIENCTHNWISANGVKGCKFTSKINGKSIFLPAAGYWDGPTLMGVRESAEYWTASLNSDFPDFAFFLCAVSWDVYFNAYGSRCMGLPIRPVSD